MIQEVSSCVHLSDSFAQQMSNLSKQFQNSTNIDPREHQEEFSQHISQQVAKMNLFLLTWSKCQCSVKLERGASTDATANSMMLTNIVTDFTKDRKTYLNLNGDLQTQMQEPKYLKDSVMQIQRLLYCIFFESEQETKSRKGQTPRFLIQQLEQLDAIVDITLQTCFRVIIAVGAEEDQSFTIFDTSPSSASSADKFHLFLLNVKSMCGILANILRNQFKLLARSRVKYCRETFNFEQYSSQGMNDQRLFRNTLFMQNGKQLMSEYFKFQLQFPKKEACFDLLTPNEVGLFLQKLNTHLVELHTINSQIDIEPLLCKNIALVIIATRLVVYFSNYTVTKVPKDALSRVSKHFFKELKMNYRQLDQLFATLTTLFYFFESTENETLKSFFQFNLVNVCEQISEEHFKFISSIIKERNFTQQNTTNKFCEELWRMNDLMKVLFHLDFKFSRFQSVRVFRDIFYKVKRFCEFSDKRLERQMEYCWKNGTPFTTQIPKQRIQ